MTKPRLGFLGLGWIGRNRLEAVALSHMAEIAILADPSPEAVDRSLPLAPGARRGTSLEDVLEARVDGIVIATPSALHAEQAVMALESGAAVFCQKPLARTAPDTMKVVQAARRYDRLLGVDFSYRMTRGMEAVKTVVSSGNIGSVYAARLVFHNAYGPDKSWFYDPTLSGGGCVIDLGIHLVDLALWVLGDVEVIDVAARLYASGRALPPGTEVVEDFAAARLDLQGGIHVDIGCSWKLHAGCDAVIAADFHGTEGGLLFHNVGGSFFDFETERYRGTARETLVRPPDDWGGRAIVDWTRRLAAGERFDAAAMQFVRCAVVLDRIYGRHLQ